MLGLLLTLLTIVGSSNAVNLTDGLDGLAIGCTLIVSFVFLVMTYLAGNAKTAEYLHIPFVSGAGELTVFCGAMVGAGLGFLWFNCHPAQVFMGDTGSLALGGALGIIAVLIHQPLVLIIAGGVFVAEAGSVILQTDLVPLHPPALWRRAAHFPHGALAPPFRKNGLVRITSRHEILYSGRALRRHGPGHFENSITVFLLLACELLRC